MAVRTRRLGAVVLSTGGIDVFVCPANRTAIVKELAVTNSNALAVLVDLFLAPAGGGQFHVLRVSLASNTTLAPPRFLVLEEGDKIFGTASAATSVAVVASGALLLGDPA